MYTKNYWHCPIPAVSVYVTIRCPSVRPSVRPSVCPVIQKQQRRAGGLPQLGCGRQESIDSTAGCRSLARLHWLPVTARIQLKKSHCWHSRHSLPISRVTFTTYSSRTARHDNSGPPVTTCLKFRGWEPVSLDAASPTVLHISGTVYLTSSLATWTSQQTLSKRNSKRFIALTATRRSTWPPRMRFVILMTNTWRAKRCIIHAHV